MLKIIVSIRDNVAEIFNDPRVEINTASAIRAFNETLKDHPHKNDFTMYQIGVMNTDNGEVLGNDPTKIASGLDIQVAESITPEMQQNDLKACN